MNRKFNSSLKNHFIEFIEFKRKLGFKYNTNSFYLLDIDKELVNSNEINPGISRKFAEDYSKLRLNECEQQRYTRISKLANFSSYLLDLNIESYVPRLPAYKKSNFIPYVFNPNEIAAIFKACDELILKNRNKNTVLFSMPLILRFLYSTGIRISELKNLKIDDINLKESYAKIKDAKNGKERLIPLDQTLTTVCKEYVKYRKHLPGDLEYFFVNQSGNKCGKAINNWFKTCLDKAEIKSIDERSKPRIHDLRHTFAVAALAKMADSGIDLYASLPTLSNYLGHQSIKATNHYVRLTTSIYPGLIKDLDKFYLDIFPKFNSYEND